MDLEEVDEVLGRCLEATNVVLGEVYVVLEEIGVVMGEIS